jgi:hypothetical protein
VNRPRRLRVRANDWHALHTAADPQPGLTVSIVSATARAGAGPALGPVEVVTDPHAATGDVVLWADDPSSLAHELPRHLALHGVIDHAVVLGRPARQVGTGFRAYRAFRLSHASVRRSLLDRVGGPESAAGEAADLDLGFRLAQAGAVFVPAWPDRGADAGPDPLLDDTGRRWLAERVSDLRRLRKGPRARTRPTPYLRVRVRAGTAGDAAVAHSVDAVVAGSVMDVACDVVAPPGERTSLIGRYVDEPRVRATPAPRCDPAAVFHVDLPAGWAPGQDTLERLTEEMNRRGQGLRCILLPDGRVARIERTASFARARLLVEPGEPLDDVVDEVSAIWWNEGIEEGFSPAPAG